MKDFLESTIELPLGEMGNARKFSDFQTFPEFLVNVRHDTRDLRAIGAAANSPMIGPHISHDPDHILFPIKQRHFGGEKPFACVRAYRASTRSMRGRFVVITFRSSARMDLTTLGG